VDLCYVACGRFDGMIWSPDDEPDPVGAQRVQRRDDIGFVVGDDACVVVDWTGFGDYAKG